MIRKTTTKTIGTAEVTSVELDFERSAELLPELLKIVARGGAAAGGDTSAIGDGIAAMAAELTGGRLLDLLPKLLAGITVIVDGENGREKHDLGTRKAINAAFSGRKSLAVPIVKLAIEENFLDFFDADVLRWLKSPGA